MFVSYLYIGLDRAILFVEQEKIEPPVRKQVPPKSQGRAQGLVDYNGIWSFLRTHEWGDIQALARVVGRILQKRLITQKIRQKGLLWIQEVGFSWRSYELLYGRSCGYLKYLIVLIVREFNYQIFI